MNLKTQSIETQEVLGDMETLNTFGEHFKFNEEQDDEIDMKEFIGDHFSQQQDNFKFDEPETHQADEGKGGLDDENDMMNFDDLDLDPENKDDEAQAKVDLDFFNKTLNKDFKTREELQSFLEKEKEVEQAEDEDKLYETAEKTVEFYSDILKLNNEDLMRRQLEYKAIQEQKDINDEDVKYDIEEAIERMRDNYVLDTNADVLRTKLQANNDAEQKTIDRIKQGREEKIKSQKDEENRVVQKTLSDMYAKGDFFGVKLSKERLANAYKASTSGKFIESLSTNKKLLSELAVFAEFKDEIFKKATGLTYSDGIKSVFQDHANSQDKGRGIATSQRQGSVGNSEDDDLINAILYSKPKPSN